jgi:hypothetical protein
MAKLPDQRIYAKASDDTSYDKKVSATVTSEGEFSIEVPRELGEMADALIHRDPWIKEGLKLVQKSGGERLRSDTLGVGVNFLRACAQEYITAEVIVERVIVYRIENQCAVFIDKNGKLHPNGYGGVRGGSEDIVEGDWWSPKMHDEFINGSMGRVAQGYSVLIGAEVWDRATHKRSTGDTIEWRPITNSEKRLPAAVERLNSFIGMSVEPEESGALVMPYTAEAAEFFTSVILALSQIAVSVDAFFADKKKLDLAVKGQLALTFGGK